MARIKYYNPDTQAWEYADTVLGVKGDKGDTPVLGEDYFTDEDKAEIVQSVLAALPTYDGGVS